MNPDQIRKKLQEYISLADEISLNYFYDLLEEYKNSGNSKGVSKDSQDEKEPSFQPMTIEAYIKRALKAEENFKEGKIHTEEAVHNFLRKLHARV